jgi:hypothetical protein
MQYCNKINIGGKIAKYCYIENFYDKLLYYFIHFYLLTIFEIIFFIYYVVVFEKMYFNNLLRQFINDILTNTKLNELLPIIIPFVNNIFILDHNCGYYNNLLTVHNNELLLKCIYYEVAVSGIMLIIFIYDIYINHSLFKKINYAINDNNNTNLVIKIINDNDINPLQSNCDNILVNDNGDDFTGETVVIHIQKRPYFICYYYTNSKLVRETYRSMNFIILIGIFEYNFFNIIVNKYIITNKDLIICNVIDGIYN